MNAGTISYSMLVQLFDDTTGAPKTGLAYDSSGVNISYARAGAARVAVTEATLANAAVAYSSGGFVEIDATNMPGMYRFDVPNAALVAGANSVTIYFIFGGVRSKSVEIKLTAVLTHEWHVAKTGNNANSGHSLDDAKLYIVSDIGGNSALTSAASGDTIIIHPGNYDENVDLDAANKSLTIEGTDRYSCKIVPGTGKGIVLENGCTLRNLNVEAQQATTGIYAVNGSGKSDITIENCDIYGRTDGLYADNCVRWFVQNCRVRGKADGFYFGSADELVVENCIFETEGTYSSASSARGASGAGRAVFKNCVFRGVRNDVTLDYTAGVAIVNPANVAFSNCTFTGSAGASSEDAYGLYIAASAAVVSLIGCSFGSTSSSATAYDINNSGGGLIVVSGCAYDIDKVNGNIKAVDSSWETILENKIETRKIKRPGTFFPP